MTELSSEEMKRRESIVTEHCYKLTDDVVKTTGWRVAAIAVGLSSFHAAKAEDASRIYDDAGLISELKSQIEKLQAEAAGYQKRIEELWPIVEAAWWDHYTAFSIPGAGYNNKAQSLAADLLGRGWEAKQTFNAYKDSLDALRKRGGG